MYIDIDNGIGTSNNPNYRIALNAVKADVAMRLMNEEVGSLTKPVYFNAGIPHECVDFLPLTAGVEKKLEGPLGFKKGIGYGDTLPESGFEGQIFFLDDQTPDIPAGGNTGEILVKNSDKDKDATWTSYFEGTAKAADGLTTNAGSAKKPVYFSGGKPHQCNDELDVNITGSSSQWAESINFTISDSDNSNTGASTEVNGSSDVTVNLPSIIKATLKGNADTSTKAEMADALSVNAGQEGIPVYFSGGKPVECKTLTLNTTGSAAKLTTPINFSISDSDKSNTGELTTNVDGSSDVNIQLPSTIKATLKGNADTSTKAVTAERLDVSNGDANIPIYFSGGIPTACSSPLKVDINGSAESIGNFTNKENNVIELENSSTIEIKTDDEIALQDSENADICSIFTPGLMSLHTTQEDKTIIEPGYIDLALSADEYLTIEPGLISWKSNGIEASINENKFSGNSDSANRLTVDGGTKNIPIYFSGGIPTQCENELYVNISGNAQTANKASSLSVEKTGDTSTPVYFNELGLPVACTSLDLSTSGNAGSANRLNITNIGNKHTPVYFTNAGIPEQIDIRNLGDLTSEFKSYMINQKSMSNEQLSWFFSKGGIQYSNILPQDIYDFIEFINENILLLNGNDSKTINFEVCLDYYPTNGDKFLLEQGYCIIKFVIKLYKDNKHEILIEQEYHLHPDENSNKVNIAHIYYYADLEQNNWSKSLQDITVPSGGMTGQALIKNSDIDGDMSWQELVALPTGGEAGQVLIKNSTSDGDASWQNISAFPKILTATYDTSDTSVSRYTVNGDDQLKDGLTIAIKLDATTAAATNSFVLNYNNSGDKTIYDSRGAAMSYYRAQAKYILILTYNLIDDCWYSVANPEPLWPISYSHTTANEKCYLVGYNVASEETSYGINRIQRNKNVYMNPSTSSIYASKVYGAVWNDYAEYRAQKEIIEPGYCVASTDNGKVYKTTEKFQACDGIVSDTFGFSIGETNECKTPLAVAGRVLAYCEGNRYNYHAGDTVCAGPDGKVCKMSREEIRKWPDRIIGIVSEIPEYECWGDGNVPINGRIWIKVK